MTDPTDTTGRLFRTSSPQRWVIRQANEFEALIEKIPFFDGLPHHLRNDFLERTISRYYNRGEQLRGINTSSSMVHVILNGCVLERTTFAESPHSSTARFFGKGSIIGASDIFLEEARPSVAECLQRTWTMSYPIDRMKLLAEMDPALMRNLAQTIALQLRTIERIYSPSRKSAAQRIAGLLLELFEICGSNDMLVMGSVDGDWNAMSTVFGPTQSDIADALMLSMASVENVLRALRQMNIVETEHRHFILTNVDQLREVAAGTLTVETPYKAKAKSKAP